MRELDSHKTNECNRAIRVTADDVDPDSGGASHWYNLELGDGLTMPIVFQHGLINKFGINGVTNEVLLAILIDRLECFQAGKFASEYNALTLDHLNSARKFLLDRTQDRLDRGVEGSNGQ